jgi:hypothetical protein
MAWHHTIDGQDVVRVDFGEGRNRYIATIRSFPVGTSFLDRLTSEEHLYTCSVFNNHIPMSSCTFNWNYDTFRASKFTVRRFQSKGRTAFIFGIEDKRVKCSVGENKAFWTEIQ